MTKDKSNQRVKPRSTPVRPTSASKRSANRARETGATLPPRSGRGATPQAEPASPAAGAASIASPVEPKIAEAGNLAGGWAGVGSKGAGVGPTAAGDGRGVEGILAERGQVHGDFLQQGMAAQSLKAAMRHTPNWVRLSGPQKEALEMIQHKIARILCGDPNHADHWDDSAGYALCGKRAQSSW